MIRVRRAFGLVELLIVLSIIALLIALLLPTVRNARQEAMSLKCMSQMRQLGGAASIYTYENHGWLASSDTAGPLYPQNFTDSAGTKIFPTVDSSHTWVGWVDGGPTAAALQNGTLWKYLRLAAIYKCPSDFNEYRTRSYSMNSFLCAGAPTGISAYFNVYKVNQLRNTSEAIAFAEECDPRSTTGASTNLVTQWNVNGWVQYPMSADAFPALAPTQDTWVDTVASWHRGGANFTFVDGHAEYWKFSDPRTINYLTNDPTWPNPYYTTPHNIDLDRIRRDIATWNIVRTPPTTAVKH
jgi:prepilin-type processing-associated H-X9-DG protein/prepilin-type N-terminal cleavage/methylation domain-containing protein